MAQNEMKAKPVLPERVRSMEGLGVSLLFILSVPFRDCESLNCCVVARLRRVCNVFVFGAQCFVEVFSNNRTYGMQCVVARQPSRVRRPIALTTGSSPSAIWFSTIA